MIPNTSSWSPWITKPTTFSPLTTDNVNVPGAVMAHSWMRCNGNDPRTFPSSFTKRRPDVLTNTSSSAFTLPARHEKGEVSLDARNENAEKGESRKTKGESREEGGRTLGILQVRHELLHAVPHDRRAHSRDRSALVKSGCGLLVSSKFPNSNGCLFRNKSQQLMTG